MLRPTKLILVKNVEYYNNYNNNKSKQFHEKIMNFMPIHVSFIISYGNFMIFHFFNDYL